MAFLSYNLYRNKKNRIEIMYKTEFLIIFVKITTKCCTLVKYIAFWSKCYNKNSRSTLVSKLAKQKIALLQLFFDLEPRGTLGQNRRAKLLGQRGCANLRWSSLKLTDTLQFTKILASTPLYVVHNYGTTEGTHFREV